MLLPLCLVLAAAALVVSSQIRSDPLAPFRGADGRLTIPGSALTPELQRLLFGGDQLLPSYELTYVSPERSAYPTVSLRSISFEVPNLNVFVHLKSTPETLADSLGHLIRAWFPPVDWHQVGVETFASVRHGIGWFLDLFTMNARADTLTVDSTTVTVVDPAAGSCTTSQSAAAGDNAVLVMLSNRGPTAYASVTYGSINLSLIPGTASSGTGFVRTEMWFYQGAIPGGAQTMTATLVSGTTKHVCATVLLGGVWPSTPTAGGTTASGTSTNPNISIAPASAGELAFAVMSIRGTTGPTAVTGTGAAATSLYGIAPTQCTGAGTSLCGAGADMPFPGTAITWTDGNATDWVVAAVRVLPVPNCGVASGNCYRIGAGGAWNTAANWSNTSGGASCGCTPVATNNAFFNASPTGTTTLAAATTIARIDMTGFTGTLDTTASNWSLTVNGAFLVQGTFLARNSTVTATADVSILTAGTIVNLGASTWTVNGIWTNQSTSGSWVAGTSTVTIRDAASGTLTFAALAGATNEFNNLTLDASVTTSITYTMATSALRLGGTLTVRNSTGGAAGSTILTSSASNLGITAGALTLATLGTLVANGSAVTVNGNVNVSAANAYVVMGSSTWTVTGTWANASTSASWSAGTGTVTFTSATGGTMTFAGTNLPGNEFNNMTFTSSAASAQTFTMATRAMAWGGTLTLSDGSSTTALATANLGLTGGALNVGNGGILTANASTITVASVTMTGGTSGTITLTTSSFTSSGNWDTSGAGSVFAGGTSTVTMTGVSTIAILNASNNFNNLTIASAGTVTQAGLLDVSSTLTVNAGASLATGVQSLTVGTLTANMAGGITAGASGTKTIGGNISIAASGFFNLGGATWNFAGAWTNSSTSASWSAGTGSVVFRAGASQTMTFKATGTEFYNLLFDTTATAGVTYTMATNPLSCGGTLTIQNSAAGPTGNAVLTTGASNLAVTVAGLTIGANGTLTANASTITDNGSWTSNAANATLNAGTSTVAFGATGTITLAVGQSFYALTQSAGTSTLGAALTATGPMTLNGTLNTGASNFAVAAQGGLAITGSLITGTSTVAVTGNVNISVAAAFITSSATGSWTVTNGNWTNATTSASWSFAAPILFTSNAGRSMTFAGSNLSGNEFAGAVAFDSSAAAGVAYAMTSRGLTVGGSVTIQNSAGGATGFTILDSSASSLSLTFGSVILATFGALNTRSSAVAITDGVAIGGTNAYVTNAGGSWMVSGSWTNASTSASWSFAASVTFNSSASQTMTFGNLTPEFAGNVTFNSGASTVTFAMASNALTIGGTLTISGGGGTTTLSTSGSNRPISAATLTVNAGGSLAANGSLITVTSMDTHLGAFAVGTSTVVIAASGGTVNVPQTVSSLTVNFGITTTFISNVSWSASLTLTGATLTFNGDLSSVGPASLSFAASSISFAGSWNTSSATAFTSTGSSITFTGSGRTITLGAGQQFESLTVAGTVSLGYDLIATSLTVNSVSTLTKTGHGIIFNALTVSGTVADGSVNVANLTVTNSDATALVTISVFGGWSAGSSYAWTHTSSEMSQTITWTIGGNAVGNLFNVTKDGSPFASGTVNGAGQVVFTMLGSDPAMQVSIAAPCAGNRYWVQGSGSWNDSNHWASSSGGSFGCSVPGPTNPVFFDGNSASATVTISGNVSIASLNTSGFSGTVAVGAYDVAVSGSVTHAGGTITMAASTGSGFAVVGSLTLSGTSNIQMSGASNGSVSGNVSVSSPTAYVRFGSGTWTFGGSWTNASTSPSWAAGSGTIIFRASANTTMTFAGTNLPASEFHHVTFDATLAAGVTYTMAANALTFSGLLTVQNTSGSPTGNTILTTSGSNLGITAGAVTIGNYGTLVGNGSTIQVGGNWTSTGTNATFNPGTSSVVFTATATIDAPQAFNNMTVSAGTSTLAADLNVNATLSISGGVLTTSTFALSTMTLILSGGALTSVSGGGTVTGNVSVSSAASYIAFGVGTWTFRGSWTNLSTSTSWSAGTGTVVFAAGSPQVMSFGNLTVSEFHSIRFSPPAAVTFTMAANGLRWSGTLTLDNNATLVTANLALIGTGGNLTILDGATLTAGTSSVNVANVTMTGGTSGTITASGSWTVSGNWDTSGAGSGFVGIASTVLLTGPGATVQISNPANGFGTLTISGSISAASGIAISGTLTVTGSLDTTSANYALTIGGGLTLNGANAALTTRASNVSVSGDVTVGSPSGFIVSVVGGSWTISGAWTNASTSGSWSFAAPITFTSSSDRVMTFAALPSGAVEFGDVTFNAGMSTVTYTMTGNALVWSGTLRVQGGTGTTTLATANVGLVGGAVTIGDGGILMASASPASVSNVTVTGGSSGVIVVTSGSWTILGSWDSSGVGSTLTAGTSTMTFAGTTKTISVAPGQAFNHLTIAGTISIASTLTAATLTVSSGAILTKTGHGITFNALTVSGTVADGSVNVANLTVTNSDATALVTISVFGGWSAGSSYAWTHTSNETTQTITWTIGGNTAWHLFNVTKDGSSFASGTVNGSGQVVFTMLGSDPEMKVSVTPPPIPAWWQSPYVLAVPPIGVFLVVAMFAQRARWRPAKAFLVDERGRMLREFTLDPSCQVTYDQAVEAGVLDAVEKPIKVAKYHGQTVRGDALGVVLLAYGPVTAEQVGFAREMLVQVQDKFEDAVKQRLEDVRSQEASLQAEGKSLEERQQALEIRAGEIESTMKQIEAVQLKVASDKAALEATEGDLERREAELTGNRRSTDELARQLEEKQKSLETRAAEIAAQSEAVDARTEAIRTREEAATALEAELRRRNEAVTSQETNLKNEAERVAAQDSSLRARLEEAERREVGVRDGEVALTANREKFEADQKGLIEFKQSIENRVAVVQATEQSLTNRENALDAREAQIAPVEADLARREGVVTQLEEELNGRKVLTDAARKELAERKTDLETREAAVARETEAVETARRSLETERHAIEETRQQAQQSFEAAQNLEAATLARSTDLDLRETRIAPAERQLNERRKEIEAGEADLASRDEQLAARARSLDTATEELGARHQSLQEDQVVLGEARAAFEADRREFQEEVARHESEVGRRKADLDAQAKTLGEGQLRMAQDREAFEASQTEKNQAILSREIELEAREQSLREKEGAVRGQAEENGRRLTELAVREESLEIEGAKLDKARAELDSRKAGLADVAKELDGKAARLREEEAKRAEERRTWQGTLESEQALLKQQRETFEEESSTMRASWADRVMRIEAREVDLEEGEERVRGGTDRIARTEEELKRRETATEEAARVASEMKGEAERLQRESEQRLLEVESRERALREEAAHHAIELTKQTEGLKALESDIAAKRSDFEQLNTGRTAELHRMETDLQKNAQALETKGRELAERESRLAASEETFRQAELRLQREHDDVQAAAKQLESRELELTQLKDRYDSEAAQIRNELEGMRQSVAAKEAELRAERERIERDSSALQETLGAKAKEMALREKALTAREDDSRADEQELEARGRELESKERQTEARNTELSAQAMALVRREQDLNARAAQIEQTVRRVETEAAEKRREWESVQATLQSQQAQLTATAETRTADLAKRTQEIEGRERAQQAWFARFELERSKVDAQAKAAAAQSAETEAAWQRSEARLADLKAKENEILRARQAFESERSAWATRRAEELKQLEATRDAAGQQAQQAERLVSESQRRALVAEEAERAAKRQAADLATQQTSLEKRRSEAEKAEHDAQAHIAQLQEASRNLAMKEMNIAAATKDLESRQSRISASEREVASREADLRSKKTSVDQDAARVAALSEQLATRQRDLESRTASLEAKSAQMSSKEQTLATELQRADNLMEDLDKKEREIRARDEALKAFEATLTARESEVTARDAELRDGTRGLEKLRQELNSQRAATDEARRVADTTREESEVMKRDAEKLRAQANTMQAEVATNLRFLQKKALDVLDQEEKIRERLMHVEERENALDARAEILEGKERTLTDDQADLDAKTAKLQAEVDRLQARLADAEKAGGPSTAAMEEWKKDVENRVKIIQKKAMDLMDREEKLRKKEEELRALAEQLGVSR